MNDLKGNQVNIVLSITEGLGFEAVKCPFYITANYNGRTMQSNMMEPHARVNVETEMVWDTDKKQLRKERCAYTAIRVECHTTDRKFIGFAMARLRSAKIIAKSSADQEVTYTWMKLLNVPNQWKKGVPQLNVSLTIRDILPTTEKAKDSAQPLHPAVQLDHSHLPVKFIADGYIQLGPDSESVDKFQIKLTSQVASNLDVLLSEDMVFCQGDQMYYLVFNIFDMNIKTRRFSRDLHESLTLNESVVINMISTFDFLSAHFKQNPIVGVKFHTNEKILGRSGIDLSKLISKMKSSTVRDVTLGKFAIEEEITFTSELTKVSEEASKRIPTLKTICTVEVVEKHIKATKTAKKVERPCKGKAEGKTKGSPKDKVEAVASANNASNPEVVPTCQPLESNEINELPKSPKESNSGKGKFKSRRIPVLKKNTGQIPERIVNEPEDTEGEETEEDTRDLSKSVPTGKAIPKYKLSETYVKSSLHRIDEISESVITLVSNEDLSELSDFSDQCHGPHSDTHLFRLDVILESITWNEKPVCRQITLCFLHPKGKGQLQIEVDISKMVDKRALLTNVICKYYYVTTKLRISQVLAQYNPKLEVRHGETGELLANQVTIANLMLSSKMMAQNCLIPLIANDGCEIAQFNISLFLEETEIPKCPSSNGHLLPEIVDDAIIAGSLEEHERWMRKERQIFQFTLDQSVKDALNNIACQNNNQGKELEGTAVGDLHAVKELATEVKKDMCKVCVEETKHRRIVDEDYDIHLERRKNFMRYAFSSKNELIQKISEVHIDNSILRDMLTEQHLELKEMRKTRLTPDQIKMLLQDLRTTEAKYEQITKDKKYFKNAFEKAVKEVHMLKVERQQFIERKIADDKESFDKLRVEAFSACIESLLQETLGDNQNTGCSSSPARPEETSEFIEVPNELDYVEGEEGAVGGTDPDAVDVEPAKKMKL